MSEKTLVPWNERIRDVRKVFDAVPDKGIYRHYSGDPLIGLIGHIQGMAQYNGYYILTQDHPGFGLGWMIIINRTKGKVVNYFNTPEYNHPGGCQVIGDYLALAVETAEGSGGSVHFYSLKELTDSAQPVQLPPLIRRGSRGAGAVGITDAEVGFQRRYIVAVYDSREVTLYQSNGFSLDSGACSFEEIFEQRLSGRGADNLCLLTDIHGQVFLIALTSDEHGTTAEDWAELYRVDFERREISLVHSRHMYNTGGLPGLPGIHFRFGAGLQISSPDEIWLYCSERNFIPPTGLAVNMFRNLRAGDSESE